MTTDSQDIGPTSRRAGMARIALLDIAGPLVVYRVCRAAGGSEVWSLVISGLPPGLGVLFDLLRWRTLEVVGAVVLGGIALSIVLAFISNNPRVVLLEGAALTAAFGVACLASLHRRRPLIFYFAQAFYGGRHSTDGAELDAEFDRYLEARSFWRTVTTVWGVTYLVEAAVRAVVVQYVSTAAALTFNRVVPWVLSGLLFGWTFWWGNRLRREKPDAEQL
jgi:hypothetical protein